MLGCRLLLATLPLLPALQELHIFSTGTISSSNIALIASLSHAHCKLQELSLSFSPLKDFVPAHLNVLERYGLSSLNLHMACLTPLLLKFLICYLANMHSTCSIYQTRSVYASVELAAPGTAHLEDFVERASATLTALSTLSSAMLRVSGSLSAPTLKTNRLCRMDALTSLSISLHAAARHMRESMGGHPRWHGDLPSGLCNLPKLTELDLSFRAFGQAELCLPQVCATAGPPACLSAWGLLIAS